MRYVFLETPAFTRLLPNYLDDDAYLSLQQALMRRPDAGRVIPGTGGFRKLRWPHIQHGKGTRGGLRVIYFVLREARQIWLFSLYSKGEVEDLTAKQCRQLKNAIQAEVGARRTGK